MRVPKLIYIVGFILTVGVLITLINIWELRSLQSEHFLNSHGALPNGQPAASNQPVVWVKAKNVTAHSFSLGIEISIPEPSREPPKTPPESTNPGPSL